MSFYGGLIRLGLFPDRAGNWRVDGHLTAHGGLSASVGRGKVFFVDSNNGSSSNNGKTPSQALDTIAAAVAKCTANQGDTIYVLPGHAEDIESAAALDFNVAGIRVVGLGWGASRPTLTLKTAITASVAITAASVIIENILFVNGIDNLTKGISISAADVTLLDIETRDNNSNYHCDDFIVTTSAADRLQVLDWVHRANGGKVGAQTAISMVGGNDVVIVPSWIDGNFATACIENVTTACDNLQIFGRANFPAYLRTRNAADVIVTCVATTKGRIGPFLNARLQDDAANITEAFVGADMEFFQPINLVNADGESSIQTNITASADAL